MTETTEMTAATDPAIAGAEAGAEREQELTEEGRYIPYGGGSMGWYENSGVMKCELGNNYIFYTAMASDRVRSKQFERWGERFNRRGPRQRFKRMLGVSVTSGRNPVRGTTRDLSRHGVRMQFLDEVVLSKGDAAEFKLYASEESQEVVFEGVARVVWSERIGRIRPIWNVGVTLDDLSAEQSAKLEPLLKDD